MKEHKNNLGMNMKNILVTYNGGKVIELTREQYLINKDYWQSQSAIIVDEFKDDANAWFGSLGKLTKTNFRNMFFSIETSCKLDDDQITYLYQQSHTTKMVINTLNKIFGDNFYDYKFNVMLLFFNLLYFSSKINTN